MSINQCLGLFYVIPETISSISLLCLLVVLYAAVEASSPDLARERRWAEQVEDGLFDGDIVWLDDGKGQGFLGVLTEGDADSGRAVLLQSVINWFAANPAPGRQIW